MSRPLILLHEEALRVTHPVFKAAPSNTKAIFVWEDSYFQQANYSLKRLVFIYETLCELPIEIFYGGASDIVQKFAPTELYVPATNNPLILKTIKNLESIAPTRAINEEAFVDIEAATEFRRFFKYWKKAEAYALEHDGGMNA